MDFGILKGNVQSKYQLPVGLRSQSRNQYAVFLQNCSKTVYCSLEWRSRAVFLHTYTLGRARWVQSHWLTDVLHLKAMRTLEIEAIHTPNVDSNSDAQCSRFMEHNMKGQINKKFLNDWLVVHTTDFTMHLSLSPYLTIQ